MSAKRNPASMSLVRLIASDMRAKADWVYGSPTRRNMLKAVLADGSAAMVIYRCMQAAQDHRLGPVAMFLNKLNIVVGGCVIGRNAQFGPGFVLIHSIGVVINTAVIGGTNVKIEHQVTIGAERNLSPVLGDDVFLGAGAKVLGAVHIGSHVKVGANAVVVKDLPDGVTAVGIPARIVRQRPETPPSVTATSAMEQDRAVLGPASR